MAEEALKSFESLLERVPGWIAEIEGILRASTERQNELLFEKQPAEDAPVVVRKKSKSSSLKSFRSGESKRGKKQTQASTPEPTLLRPQIPHMTESDALRLAQRKRKTASVCSGDQSGPAKYRSRSMVVVYYDGDVQKKFEMLVRSLGASRNVIRKGKMSARVDSLSRSGSSSSETSNSGGEDACVQLGKLGYRSTRPKAANGALFGQDESGVAFDRVDGLLEKGQTLCERAAHQVLRDGDCAQELQDAREYFTNAKAAAEGELPALRKRADKAAERQRRSDERRRAQDEANEHKRQAEAPSTEKLLVPYPAADGKLEVDLEADDSDDEDGGEFDAPGLDLGQYQMRTRLAAH